jgi:hypothetical protein
MESLKKCIRMKKKKNKKYLKPQIVQLIRTNIYIDNGKNKSHPRKWLEIRKMRLMGTRNLLNLWWRMEMQKSNFLQMQKCSIMTFISKCLNMLQMIKGWGVAWILTSQKKHIFISLICKLLPQCLFRITLLMIMDQMNWADAKSMWVLLNEAGLIKFIQEEQLQVVITEEIFKSSHQKTVLHVVSLPVLILHIEQLVNLKATIRIVMETKVWALQLSVREYHLCLFLMRWTIKVNKRKFHEIS